MVSAWTSLTLLHCLGVSGSLIAALLILPILAMIRAESSPTPINQLIGVDCLLRLSNIPYILYWSKVFSYWGLNSPLACSLRVTLSYTTSMVSRLLTISMAVCRWVYVCRPHLVFSAAQRSRFFRWLVGSLVVVAGSLSMGAYTYREEYTIYYRCLGITLPGRVAFTLPIANPFRLANLAIFFGYLAVSPVLYMLVSRCRVHQPKVGLSDLCLQRRRTRNLVSARFNFFIWLSESLVLLVLVPRDPGVEEGDVMLVLYLILSSCVTPVLCYTSIESNREKVGWRNMDMVEAVVRATSWLLSIKG